VRLRLLAAVSAISASALLLAGCAGGSGDSADPTSSPSAGGCVLDTKSGAASDAVKVTGDGADAKVEIPAGTEMSNLERTVLEKGKGKDIGQNDLVSVQYQIVDATNNTVLDSSARGEGGTLPVLLDQQSSLFVAALECQPLGSRIVMTVPSSMTSNGGNSFVVYAQATELLPTKATGTSVAADKSMPAVDLDKDGAPNITIPQGATAPTETKVAVLKQGDGPTVGAGDLVAVQYRGVKWSDGSEFDSSWKRGAPAQFVTSQVVAGFRTALEGQKVGSQVEVVIPPKDGYGEKSDSNTAQLAGETLVFVVDILATTPSAQK